VLAGSDEHCNNKKNKATRQKHCIACVADVADATWLTRVGATKGCPLPKALLPAEREYAISALLGRRPMAADPVRASLPLLPGRRSKGLEGISPCKTADPPGDESLCTRQPGWASRPL
jgi:hypothetical protein